MQMKDLLEETYDISKPDTPAKNEKLAQALKETLDAGELSTDERYVIATTLMDVSREADQFELFWAAVELLAKTYEVDALELQAKSLKEFLKRSKDAESLKLAIAQSIAVAGQQAIENRFSDALSLLRSAESANRHLPAATSAKQALTDAKKSVTGREAQWKAFQKGHGRPAEEARRSRSELRGR